MTKSLVPESISKNLPSAVKSSLNAMTPQQQEEFLEEYKRRSKSVGVAYLLWFFLGFHYAYLRSWGVQFLYWITIGGLFIWTFIDLFRLAGVVRNRNRDIAMDTMREIKTISGV